MLPSGIAETRSVPAGGIQPQANGTATIDVTSAFSQTPTAGSVFLVQTSDIQSQQFRIVSVAETEEGVYGVSATAYNATIYDAVESDNELTTRDITNLSATPNPVSALPLKSSSTKQDKACLLVRQSAGSMIASTSASFAFSIALMMTTSRP